MKEGDAAPDAKKIAKHQRKSRRARRRPAALLAEYVRRQRNNAWTETHLWHAKRAHMANLWGYRVATRMTEKNQRSAHRALAHHATAFDASYYAAIEVAGPRSEVVAVVAGLEAPSAGALSAGPVVGRKMYADGGRAGRTLLYRPGEWPRGLLAPVEFMWRPPSAEADGEAARCLWIWVHPAAFLDVLAMLKAGADANGAVAVASLRDSLVRFEVAGPRASFFLRKVLKVASGAAANGTGAEVWDTLSVLDDPQAVPSGAVLALSVYDPRLVRPARSAAIMHADDERRRTPEFRRGLHALRQGWPADGATAAGSRLWDAAYRTTARESRAKVHTLNAKRGAFAVPADADLCGDPEVNVPVDVLLVQTPGTTAAKAHVAASGTAARQRASGRQTMGGGWTLILPAGWAIPFWKELIYGGARAIGLLGRCRGLHEQGAAVFPDDYPDTKAYAEYAAWRAQAREDMHNRRPVAKRVNYLALNVADPFAPNWALTTGSEGDGTASSDGTQAAAVPVVVRDSVLVQALLEAVDRVDDPAGADAAIDQVLEAAAGELAAGAPFLLELRLEMTGKGVPVEGSTLAMAAVTAAAGEPMAEPTNRTEALVPPACPTVGYVTTGGFAYAQGHGLAVACASGRAILRGRAAGLRSDGGVDLLVRRPTSLTYRPAVGRVVGSRARLQSSRRRGGGGGGGKKKRR